VAHLRNFESFNAYRYFARKASRSTLRPHPGFLAKSAWIKSMAMPLNNLKLYPVLNPARPASQAWRSGPSQISELIPDGWLGRMIRKTSHNNVEQAYLNIDALASSCLVGWDHNICCQTQQCLGFKDIFIRHGSDN